MNKSGLMIVVVFVGICVYLLTSKPDMIISLG
jgi:hypothetical protein